MKRKCLYFLLLSYSLLYQNAVAVNSKSVSCDGREGMSRTLFLSFDEDKIDTCGFDKMAVEIFFKVGKSTIDTLLSGNKASLDRISEFFSKSNNDSTIIIKNIELTSSASIEGDVKKNEVLSEERLKTLSEYMKRTYGVEENKMIKRNLANNWNGLRKLVYESDMPYRAEVLGIIDNDPESKIINGKLVYLRKERLMQLEKGAAYHYMLEKFFPKLRNGSIATIYYVRAKEQPKTVETIKEFEEEPKKDTLFVLPAIVADTVAKNLTDTVSVKKPFFWAASTNMLYDALLVPNVALEAYMGKLWSIKAGWAYAWWSNNPKHNYWRVYGGGMEVRRWFGKASLAKPLHGHHVAAYAMAGRYDFEFGGDGVLSDFSYSAGLSYGYSFPISRHFNIDAGIGFGYFGGRYKDYYPDEECYVWKRTRDRNYLGPTKVEVSLVWLLGKGNVNSKKGANIKSVKP